MARKVVINKNLYGVGLYGVGYYGEGNEFNMLDDWNYGKSINNNASMNCTIESLTIPDKGNQFEFYVDDVLEFAGIIKKVRTYEYTPNYLYHDLVIQDFSLLTDKRLFGASFDNKSCSYIINYMITNILVDEGITAGAIEDGVTFDRVKFDYKTCTDALNYIVEACPGYNWTINKYKQINFVSKYTNKCETIVDSSFLHYDFSMDKSLDGYMNKLYIEGGKKRTVEFSNYLPSPKPDGTSRTFTLSYPIANEPTIEINRGTGWVSQTVGINGLTEDKNFYWTYGSADITQDSDDTVLASTDQIRVTFIGLIDLRMIVQDEDKINEMMGVEGTTGIYEAIYNDNKLETNKAGYQVGMSVIQKYSQLDTISFRCEDLGDMEVNKLVKVTKTLYDIDDWFLIERIDVSGFNADTLTYDITCLYGSTLGGWEKYFKSLLFQSTDISNEDVFVQTKLQSDNWDYQAVTYFRISTPILCSESTIISDTLIMGTVKGGEDLYD